jgi:hypothetical protein
MGALIDWIESTWLSNLVFEYGWLWPISEALHFTGLVLLVGTVGLFDLRVLGLGRGIPPAAIHRLVPFGLVGFALSIATGVLFIAGTPDQYFYNSAFHFKLVFLTLMGLNVAFFYFGPHRAVMALGPAEAAPRSARLSAVVSLLMLLGVMSAGRMLTFFRPAYIF